MMTATIVKLRSVGESITLTVQECQKAQRGQYPGVEFIGTDGSGLVAVEVPEKSADKQLERLGLDRASVVGRTVTISRAENRTDATKPYWNITAAANGKPPIMKPAIAQPAEFGGPIPGLDDDDDLPPPVEEAYAPAPASTDKLNPLFTLYDACFDHAAHLARRHADFMPDVAAMAATLFIQANQRGIR